MKNLNRMAILFLAIVLSANFAFAQEEEEEKDKRPVRAPFESSILLDNQTVVVPTKGTMQFEIQHRFGTLENGLSDFFGMWAPSNIRLGMGYTVVDNIMVGVGATKFNKFVDVNYKWNFLKQTRSGSTPVALTWYGFVAFDTRSDDFFAETTHRISYFNELIIARRFNHKLSMQLIPSFTHFNAVDSLYSNDVLALTVDGRYKLSGQSSFIFEFDYPFTTHEAMLVDGDEEKELPLPNLSLGVEISTSTHAFQIFFANYQDIVYHKNIAFNQNDWSGWGGWLLGFNITRLWNF